jgi:hypothetical protein
VEDALRRRRRVLLGATCLAGVSVVAAVWLAAWDIVVFVVAVVVLLAASVLWVSRQEAGLRRRDDGGGCTSYAKIRGSGTFLLTFDETGVGLRGSSRATRRLPPEHHRWETVDDLRIERVGPYGSGGELSMWLPDRELCASIGRVDEMIAAAGRYRVAAEGGPVVEP